MSKKHIKIVNFPQTNEITSPEEYMQRFRDLLVSISEPEHFFKMIELLNMMDIGGALAYSTRNETERGLFISHFFNQVQYDEEKLTVSFLNTKDNKRNDCNVSEFVIPIEKIESVKGYISIVDDAEDEFYCLNISIPEGDIKVAWDC